MVALHHENDERMGSQDDVTNRKVQEKGTREVGKLSGQEREER